MQSALRRCDRLARWGGEEFAALLPETDSRGAMLAAERLRGLVASQTQRTQAGDIATSISVGVAEIGPDTADLAQLIATADRALYRAKAGGRNCVVIAESEPRTP
jgi:diguanylate cyclase (GGDEF)-like protein